MSQIQIDLHRKRTVRNLNGDIIDMTDGNGKPIIVKGNIVNQQAIDEIALKEQDKRSAAQAVTAVIDSPHAEERVAPPTKLNELEKKVEGIESKLDQILNALNK